MYGENDEDKKYKPCTFEGFDAYSQTINLGTVENTRLHYYVDYPVEDKGEESFTEYTLGEYSGYRSMSYTNYWNSANDTTYRYKLNYPVGDKNVILSCSVTLRDNSDDTTGLEDVMLATLQQLKVEIK